MHTSQGNSPQKKILHQSSISGFTSDSTMIKIADAGQYSTILPKTKKPSNDSSAIFTNLQNLLKFYEEPNYIPSHCNITEAERCKAKEIQLNNSIGNLLQQSPIHIDAFGLKNNSSRKDCLCYFWLTNESMTNSNSNKDVILSYQSKSFTFNNDYIFMIFYIKELEQYKIKINPIYTKELYEHLYFSIPKSEEIPLNTKEYIFLDNLQFQITLKSNSIIEIINLENSKKYIFSSMLMPKITIGKGEDCTISFPNKSHLCNVHIAIIFKKQWMIKDLSSKEKQCWMYSDSSYRIYNDFIIKIDSSSLMISM